MKTEKYNVTGMTCAACQANVTRCVSKLSGVSEVNVSLLSNNMTVTYDENAVTEGDICQAVSKIGYDGREMRIGDRMTVGPLVIERIRPQAKDYFSERGSVTYGQSANRKRANTKPKSGQKQSCGSCKGKSCNGGQCKSNCGSCNRKTRPAKNNPTAKRRC